MNDELKSEECKPVSLTACKDCKYYIIDSGACHNPDTMVVGATYFDNYKGEFVTVKNYKWASDVNTGDGPCLYFSQKSEEQDSSQTKWQKLKIN